MSVIGFVALILVVTVLSGSRDLPACPGLRPPPYKHVGDKAGSDLHPRVSPANTRSIRDKVPFTWENGDCENAMTPSGRHLSGDETSEEEAQGGVGRA